MSRGIASHLANVAGVLCLLWVFFALTAGPTARVTTTTSFLLVALCFVSVTIETYILIRRLWGSRLFQICIGVTASVLTLITSIYASHVVHGHVHESPGFFTLTLSALTILLLPIVLVVAASWIGMGVALAILGMFLVRQQAVDVSRGFLGTFIGVATWVVSGRRPPEQKPPSAALAFTRVIGFGLISVWSFVGFIANEQAKTYIGIDFDWVAGRVIEQTGFYRDSRCQGLPEGARVAYLEGDRISVTTRTRRGKVEFSTQKCRRSLTEDR